MTSWVLVALVPLLHVASLAPPEETAERARFAERDLDYDRAADLWLEVIGNPATSEALRFEANLQAGAIERIRGNDTEARFHFQYVLRKAPDHRLPDDTPPKVRNFFELVRQEVRAEAARPAPVVATVAEVVPPVVPPPATTEGDLSPTERTTSAADAGLPLLPIVFLSGAGVVALVGIVALGAGSLFGLLAWDQYNNALAASVQVERQSIYEQAQGSALIANVGFGAGAAGILAAVALAGVGGGLWAIE